MEVARRTLPCILFYRKLVSVKVETDETYYQNFDIDADRCKLAGMILHLFRL
jgi:hypothetical protein